MHGIWELKKAPFFCWNISENNSIKQERKYRGKNSENSDEILMNTDKEYQSFMNFPAKNP
jgi:hypothetical protein